MSLSGGGIHSKEHRDVHKVKNVLKDIGMEVLPVSALTGEGLEELKGKILQRWEEGKEDFFQ